MRIAVRLGGFVYSGARAGLLYFNANNAPSNANWNYGGGLTTQPVSVMDAYAVYQTVYINIQSKDWRILFRGCRKVTKIIRLDWLSRNRTASRI